MLTKTLAGLFACCAVTGVAACGGGGDDAETTGDFLAQADAACQDAFDQFQPITVTPQENENEAARLVEANTKVAGGLPDALQALTPPGEIASDYDALIANYEDRTKLNAQFADASPEEAADLGKQSSDLAAERYELSESLGLEVCGHSFFAARDPQATQPLADTVADLAAAVKDDDCEALDTLSVSTLIFTPAFCDQTLAAYAKLDPATAETEEYGGTAAIVQYPAASGKGVEVQPFVVEADETYRALAVYQNQEAVGTDPDPDNQFQEVADAAVEAAKTSDCDALQKIQDPEVGYVDPEIACSEAFTFMAPLLAADPGAQAVELGANAWFAFYELRNDRGDYVTLVVTHKDEDDSPEAQTNGGYKFAYAVPPLRF